MSILPEPPPISKVQILENAHIVWLEYIKEVGPEYVLRCGVDFDKVYEAVLYPKYEIFLDREQDLGVDDFGDPILGRFIPKENTALIDKKLFELRDPRRVFTEWHETAGHGILHGAFLRKNVSRKAKLFTTEKSMKLIENTFEWQANTFGVNVAAPRIYVWCMYRKLFGTNRKIRFCGPCRYCLILNNKHWYFYATSPYQLAWIIAKKMQHYFWGLSAQSLTYRVLEVAIDNNGYGQGDFGQRGFACQWSKVVNDIVGIDG